MTKDIKLPTTVNSMSGLIGYLEGSIMFNMKKLQQVDSDNVTETVKEITKSLQNTLQISEKVWQDLKSKGEIH